MRTVLQFGDKFWKYRNMRTGLPECWLGDKLWPEAYEPDDMPDDDDDDRETPPDVVALLGFDPDQEPITDSDSEWSQGQPL